jgi:hypothetical protein
VSKESKLTICTVVVCFGLTLSSIYSTYTRDKAVRELGEARQDVRATVAKYNSLLAGRDCEVPE